MFRIPLLLLARAVVGVTCLRLCPAAVRGAVVADSDAAGAGREPTPYEAAFLSGGPGRVADLTLVATARRRRLPAHTGWATIVDPHGRNERERSVTGVTGPQGRLPLAPVRAAAATADAVRGIAERLVGAGPAVPGGGAATVAEAVRQVRLAVPAVVGPATAALLVPVPSQMPRLPVAPWFALPPLLTAGCPAIARFEVHPYAPWASPTGVCRARCPAAPAATVRTSPPSRCAASAR
ncbi:TIGR04222 domain-containing membrane protein [Streptomyces sp. YIM B13518]|uniref:TIGR04222 domain-containing membrane protein n=1 Tax=Streptomyces sp. YIM B13518 TaxID=3366316 RepID=UPI0036875EF6